VKLDTLHRTECLTHLSLLLAEREGNRSVLSPLVIPSPVTNTASTAVHVRAIRQY